MFSAFANSLKVKELRSRILFTAGVIVLCRIAANIPCPGVDPAALKEYFSQFGGDVGMLMGMFDMFSGGALQQFALATLGIMPYISASIIMQLLVPVLPQLEKLKREGDAGRQKINQYTRYLTVLICIVQGGMAALAMINPGRINLPNPARPLVTDGGPFFIIMAIVVLTCGTMVLLWLGERITERGIGNGVSIIITIGIVDRLPSAFWQVWEMLMTEGVGSRFRLVHVLILLIVFVAVTSATILMTQAMRKIPIQMAKRVVGNKMKGGSTYMPLKLNFSGVMPIIFAGAILIIPGMLLNWIPQTRFMAGWFAYGTMPYMFFEGILIILFSYFWVANQFNPIEISENLKKEGAFIPGIRPGKPTADFLDNTMTRITLAGALFLTALAIFPMFLYEKFRIPMSIASFFGGTSLLIIVGVVLDTLKQLESHLLMRNYDGFLKKGRVRGRRD